MSDGKNQTRKPDQAWIDISDKQQVRYWARNLGVTEDRLRQTVMTVGNSVASVRKYLKP